MRDIQSRDNRCDNLVAIMLEDGTINAKGNHKEQICELARLFYDHYHFDEYDTKDVLTLFHVLFVDVISHENVRISIFGSTQAAFEALAPKFERSVEDHADCDDHWMEPDFMDELDDLASYIATGRHLFETLDDSEDKLAVNRAAKVAFDRFVSLGEKLKTEKYLWRSDLAAIYNNLLRKLYYDLFNENKE